MAGSAVRVMGQKGLEVASLLPRLIRVRIGGTRLDWEDGAEAADFKAHLFDRLSALGIPAGSRVRV